MPKRSNGKQPTQRRNKIKLKSRPIVPREEQQKKEKKNDDGRIRYA